MNKDQDSASNTHQVFQYVSNPQSASSAAQAIPAGRQLVNGGIGIQSQLEAGAPSIYSPNAKQATIASSPFDFSTHRLMGAENVPFQAGPVGIGPVRGINDTMSALERNVWLPNSISTNASIDLLPRRAFTNNVSAVTDKIQDSIYYMANRIYPAVSMEYDKMPSGSVMSSGGNGQQFTAQFAPIKNNDTGIPVLSPVRVARGTPSVQDMISVGDIEHEAERTACFSSDLLRKIGFVYNRHLQEWQLGDANDELDSSNVEYVNLVALASGVTDASPHVAFVPNSEVFQAFDQGMAEKCVACAFATSLAIMYGCTNRKHKAVRYSANYMYLVQRLLECGPVVANKSLGRCSCGKNCEGVCDALCGALLSVVAYASLKNGFIPDSVWKQTVQDCLDGQQACTHESLAEQGGEARVQVFEKLRNEWPLDLRGRISGWARIDVFQRPPDLLTCIKRCLQQHLPVLLNLKVTRNQSAFFNALSDSTMCFTDETEREVKNKTVAGRFSAPEPSFAEAPCTCSMAEADIDPCSSSITHDDREALGDKHLRAFRVPSSLRLPEQVQGRADERSMDGECLRNVYNKRFSLPPPQGKSTDMGHCVVVVGYSDLYGAFQVQNSAGPSWGAHGFFNIPYARFGVNAMTREKGLAKRLAHGAIVLLGAL